MTQIERYSQLRKLKIDKIRGHVEVYISRTGSLLGETIESTVDRVVTRYAIESKDETAEIASLIRNARNGCFVRAAIRKTVAIEDNDTLNGVPLDLTR